LGNPELEIINTNNLNPTDADKIAWLRLIRSENIGPLTFFQLLDRFKTPQNALIALPDMARKGGLKRNIKICPLVDAESEYENTLKMGADILLYKDPCYPAQLKQIADPPPVLTVRGRIDLLSDSILAIVGARNASIVGKRIAKNFASGLGQNDFTIVSGLARGIDAAAHEGSLETGTIGVVAGGVDHIYPPENTALYDLMIEKGTIISEAPLGAAPQSRHFPRRNRIVAGLSKGIIIIEAALQSGSLITARFGIDFGRDILVVPGSPLDPRYRGSNRLLKDGATLVEDVEDVLDSLAQTYILPQLAEEQTTYDVTPSVENLDDTTLNSVRKAIIENLSPTPVAIDYIIRQCQFPTSHVVCTLLELELAGRIIRYPGNQIALVNI
jgi:DNA processing protein